MEAKPDKFFVITGGPGSGKSTLIEALRSAGYDTIAEGARTIIQEQVAIGGHALPWIDASLFAELMLMWDIRSYRGARKLNGPVFFDRGVPDVVGYLELMKLPVPGYFRAAVAQFRYNQHVFIAPPWQEIFTQDRERKQDFAEAVRTYEAMRCYIGAGYKLIELPRVSLEERVQFVLQTIRS